MCDTWDEPLPMDPETMAQVTLGLPLEETMGQMDAVTQVTAFCAAQDPAVAFIDLVSPHCKAVWAVGVQHRLPPAG